MLESASIKNLLLKISKQYTGEVDHRLQDVLIVSVQHILETTYDMFSALKAYGLESAVVAGKSYSTHLPTSKKIEALGFDYIEDSCQLGYGRFDDCMHDVVHRVWAKALEKIAKKKYRVMVILDDGADLLRSTPGIFFDAFKNISFKNKPSFIVGVEQTRGGTNHPLFSGLPFPIIDVAGSYIKTIIEYPKVASVVAEKVSDFLSSKGLFDSQYLPIIGVIGYGSMGAAISKVFVAKGHRVIVYDPRFQNKENTEKGVTFYSHSSTLIANANIIIGCTGRDVTEDASNISALLYSQQDKILVSTSSKDYEFNAFLRVIQNETKEMGVIPDPLENISFTNFVGSNIQVLRGGFPVNFDNGPHCVPPKHIWSTRVALMLSCIYGSSLSEKDFRDERKKINTIALPSSIQRMILREYLMNFNTDPLVSCFETMNDDDLEEYLARHSDSDAVKFATKNINHV